MKMDDFTKQAKEKYDGLQKQEEKLKVEIAELQKEKKALKAYLIEKGILERRKRKPKA